QSRLPAVHQDQPLPEPGLHGVRGHLRRAALRLDPEQADPIQAFGENFDRIVDVLGRDENIDVVAVEVSTGRLSQNPEMLEGRIKAFKAFQASSTKPIIAVLSSSMPKADSTTLESMERRFSQEGIPAFLGFERGARALKNVVDYHSQRIFLGE
ncbi:MAG: hypothetical protein AAB303_05420, partial [Chloroflexota bacterium]